MKITEKIVTSITQPQQTNVLWHNPETGELKMFGNTGWEVVGGKPGEGDSENTNTNGYPVVDVPVTKFTFDLVPENAYDEYIQIIPDAKPGIYYNASLNSLMYQKDSWLEVDINPFTQFPKGTKACFLQLAEMPIVNDTAEDWEMDWAYYTTDLFYNYQLAFLIPTDKEGYKYQLVSQTKCDVYDNYFTDDPKIGDFLQIMDNIKIEIVDCYVSDAITHDSLHCYWYIIDNNIVETVTYYDKQYNVYNAIQFDGEGVNQTQMYTTETITDKSKLFVFYTDLGFDDSGTPTEYGNDGIGTVYTNNEYMENIQEYVIDHTSGQNGSIYANFPIQYNNDTYPNMDVDYPTRIVTSIVDGVACFTQTPKVYLD